MSYLRVLDDVLAETSCSTLLTIMTFLFIGGVDPDRRRAAEDSAVMRSTLARVSFARAVRRSTDCDTSDSVLSSPPAAL